ncbi:MAG: response regulator [Rhizobiales bacterium]|nr:response regulator [Hyphomicrobiales bacterium]
MQDDERRVLSLPARMDLAAARVLHEVLRERLRDGAALVLDASGVEVMTTPAAQLILSALRTFASASLAHPSICVEDAFRDMGVDWRSAANVKKPDAAFADAQGAEESAARHSESPPRRILTIDDSKTMRDMLMLTLSNAGFDVIQGADGLDGLTVLGDSPVDVVITDINMPVMDGYEVIRRLRQNDSHRTTPILVLTTEGDAEKREIAREAGATGWIVKPFDPDRLIETVRYVSNA